MTFTQARTISLLSSLIVTIALASGCSKSPQEKYNDAMSNLHDAKQSMQNAQDKVNDQKQNVAKAQKKLDEAQSKLQDAHQKVTQATQAVDKTVNSDVLFRTLQRKLLDKDKFPDSAISVAVKKRVVTLTGTVPDKDTQKKAVSIARNQPGVKSVNNSLQIPKKQSSGHNKHQKDSQGAGQSGQHNASGGGGR